MSEPGKGIGPFLLGIDYGTESCRAGVFDTDGRPLASEATTYALTHPRPGWAEQDPDEWWSALVRSVRAVIDQSGVSPDAIAGLSVDATTCTVVALDTAGHHLRPAIMWMTCGPRIRRAGSASPIIRRASTTAAADRCRPSGFHRSCCGSRSTSTIPTPRPRTSSMRPTGRLSGSPAG